MRKRTIAVLFVFALSAWLAAPVCKAQHVAPPPPRDGKAIQAILARAPRASAARKLNIVLVAGTKDHGPNEHDYPLWQKRWKALVGGLKPGDEPVLNTFGPPQPVAKEDLAGAENVRVTTAWEWPSADQWKSAELVVMFSAPSWNDKRLAELETYLARGGGLVLVHMPVWYPSPKLVSLVGTAFQNVSQYRHGPVTLRLAGRRHPICFGLPSEIDLLDESYFNLRLDLADGDILATSRETRTGESAPRDEPMFWARQRGKGRVFVCIAGHYMWTFDDPLARILLLRGMAWAAGESPYRFDPLVLRGARVVRPVKPEPPAADDPDLVLWLDASEKKSLALDQGGAVSEWRNKASRGGRAVKADGEHRPRWIADAVGKMPAVRFDGKDDVLRDAEFGGSAGQWTLFLVVAPRSNRGSGIPAGFHGFFSANAPGKQDFTSGINLDMGGMETDGFSCLNVEGSKAGGACNLLDQASEFGKTRVLAIATDNDLTTLYAESETQGVRGASDAETSLSQVRVGARCYLNGRETGFVGADIAELILYKRCLPVDRIAAVSGYLQAKYAVVLAETPPLSLDDAMAALATYDWGKSRRALGAIDEVIRQGDPAAVAGLEKRLAAALAKGLPPAGSDFVCRRLARIGGAASVPVLVRLLGDENRAAMARYALIQIPDDAASEALLASFPQTTGPARLEVIRSLGHRRFMGENARLSGLTRLLILSRLLYRGDKQEADAALAALAELGESTPVEPALARADAPADTLLTLAERLGAGGHKELAKRIYDRLAASSAPQVQAAVLRGLVLLEPDRAAERLLAALAGDEIRLRGQAVSLVAQTCGERVAAGVVERFDTLPPAAQQALVDVNWTRLPALGRRCGLAGAASENPEIRRGATRLLRDVGKAEDIELLAHMATDPRPEVKDAAQLALKYLAAEGTNLAIIDRLAKSDAAGREVLIVAARQRQLTQAVPALVDLAASGDPKTRMAALAALETLGGPSNVPTLAARLLAARSSEERAAAERAVWLCARKAKDPRTAADPLLEIIKDASPADRAVLLPVLGRLGGDRTLAVVREARKSNDAAQRDAAARALANWPDATVAEELFDLADHSENDSQRIAALRGYIRVVTLRGVRPDHETLVLLRRAMPLATRVEEQRLILSRLPAMVVPESLEVALSYLDRQELRDEAITTSTRLAELLLPKHPEAAKTAMRRILAVATNQKLRDRLERQLKK